MSDSLPSLSGALITLHADGYTAEVVQAGAALRSLTKDGRDLVLPFGRDAVRPDMRGAVLQPWPNRIADGRYRFGGEEHELAWTEPGSRTAIHGLVAWLAYEIVGQDDDRVTLAATLLPQQGYPFGLRSEVTYRLGPAGLTIEVAALNLGSRPAPYGAGLHPYLVAGSGPVDDWTLTLPATSCIEHHPPRYLPGPERPVAGADNDFGPGRQVGPRHLCHAYHGLPRDAEGWAEARVTAPDGSGVLLRCDRTADWLMVFTYDLDTDAARTGLAVEPMTGPADAFNSGVDLVVLDPAQRHTMRTVIAALP